VPVHSIADAKNIPNAKKTKMTPDFAACIAKLPSFSQRPNLIRFVCDDKVVAALELNEQRRARGKVCLIVGRRDRRPRVQIVRIVSVPRTRPISAARRLMRIMVRLVLGRRRHRSRRQRRSRADSRGSGGRTANGRLRGGGRI
jgi:hypothetical protein